MQISALGDSALILRLGDKFDSEKTIDSVLEVARKIAAAQIAGVIELVPAYTTIGIFYDPIATIDAGAPVDGIESWLEEKITAALKTRSRKIRSRSARSIEVPVCYDPQFALDLGEMAQALALSAEEIVSRHSRADYRVACVGFTPGFPYLSGLPKELARPRRETPRTKIPAGSVAIGGWQTGIYPVESPGGWHVIGRTPLELFDPKKNPPALLQAGDRVRFRTITRDEFENWRA